MIVETVMKQLPLMKSVFRPLAKSVLVPLGLTAAASVTDAAIHNCAYSFQQRNKWRNENS